MTSSVRWTTRCDMRHAKAKCTPHAGGHLANIGVRLLDLLVDRRHPSAERIADRGQPNGTARTAEKAATDSGFERADYLTHARVGDAESLRCMAEVKLFTDYQEYADFPKLIGFNW